MKSQPPYLSKLFNSFSSCYRSAANSIFSLFFPWRCPLCNDLQRYAEVLCEPCSKGLPRIQEAQCRICGAQFPERWLVTVCPECKMVRPKLTRIRSVFLYEAAIIQMIREMKFAKKARYARYFAEQLNLAMLEKFPRSVAAIVPVPLHRSREWERTFDQTRLISNHLSRLSGIPVLSCLRRRRKTLPQTALSGAARRRNLQGAFQMKKNVKLPSPVVLVDDVITTGATLEECALVLRKAGVKRVYGLTVARAMLKS
jgi:ComF family protein